MAKVLNRLYIKRICKFNYRHARIGRMFFTLNRKDLHELEDELVRACNSTVDNHTVYCVVSVLDERVFVYFSDNCVYIGLDLVKGDYWNEQDDELYNEIMEKEE